MIYEAICFGYETDMLIGRMATLGEHVDGVVIVESDHTHTGHPKPLYVPGLLPYLPHADKVTHWPLIVPAGGNSWDNERRHRAELKHAIRQTFHPEPDDLVIVCDVDEWWEPEHLPQMGPDLTVMNMRKHHFSARWFDCMELAGLAASWQVWEGLDFHQVKMAMCSARSGSGSPGRILDTGWHFTSLGSEGAVMHKVGAFSHTEFDTPAMRATISGLWRNGQSLDGRMFTEVPLDDLPDWIAEGHAPEPWYRTREV